MTPDDDMSEEELAELEGAIADQRRRELVVEHLFFQTATYVERMHPGLVDHLDESVEHLGDSADDETKDDEAVRDIARRFIKSLKDTVAKD